MEFKVITDLERSIPAAIDFNFEELKTELSGKLEHYKALVVTEDSIKTGREERAKLNKLKSAIDDRRKEVKKLCLAPYESFEAKCKELTGMIYEASVSIDRQVKAFEEAEKNEKRAQIEAVYLNAVGDLSGMLPFELFFNPKWLNKSLALPAVAEELSGMVESSKKDVKAIRDMHLTNETAALSVYSKTRDLGAAMAENMRLQKLARETAEKLPPAEPEIRTVPGHGELTQRQAEQMKNAMDAAFSEETPKTIQLIFYDTTAAFRAEMKALTQKHNVKYDGVRCGGAR